MDINYDQLTIPDGFKPLLREVVKGIPDREIPKGWTCILIYHPATNQYYCSKSISPLEYETIVRNRLQPRWNSIAIALRKMLEYNSAFQFFILHTSARPTVEKWLATLGKRRVVTKMGEGDSPDRVIFEVYSQQNKIKRYVSAPKNTTVSKIIAQANAGLALWLASPATEHRHERRSMQVALRSLGKPNTKVFEKESLVTMTTLLERQPHNQYRTICANHNLNAVKRFIINTTLA